MTTPNLKEFAGHQDGIAVALALAIPDVPGGGPVAKFTSRPTPRGVRQVAGAIATGRRGRLFFIFLPPEGGSYSRLLPPKGGSYISREDESRGFRLQAEGKRPAEEKTRGFRL